MADTVLTYSLTKTCIDLKYVRNCFRSSLNTFEDFGFNQNTKAHHPYHHGQLFVVLSRLSFLRFFFFFSLSNKH